MESCFVAVDIIISRSSGSGSGSSSSSSSISSISRLYLSVWTVLSFCQTNCGNWVFSC